MTPSEPGEYGPTLKDRRARLTAIVSLAWLAGASLACTGRISGKGDGVTSPTGGAPSGTGGTGTPPAPGTGGAGNTTTTGGATGAAGSTISTGAGGTSAPVSACNGTVTPGRSPLRRLNGVEYDNTVRDLVGATMAYSTTFPPPELGSGFSNNADALVTNNLLAEGYQRAAEEMAAKAVMNLGALAPACNTTTSGAATCAKSFIQAFGKKAFRRPLTTEEVTRYTTLFTTGSTGATYNDGIALVIEAVLQSPHFLYRVEAGVATANPTVAALTPHELATRMSYFLWQSMPDDALLAAADANQLATNEQLATQLDRMLNGERADRAKQMVAQFHREWLFLTDILRGDKPTSLYPNWTSQLAADIFSESDTFVGQVFWGDGKLATLLTAPYSYMNANVAKHYGLPAPSGTGFVKVNQDPTQRAGLLTMGAFLAGQAKPDQSSPVLRGKFVREQFLCDEVAPPPNDIVIVIPAVTPGTTTRERFTTHESQTLCASCHQMMDPIGFAFEGFDAVGNARTTDGGKPVDASGQIIAAADPNLNGAFNGALELANKLQGSPAVASCVAKQWFRWGTGRKESTADACSLEMVTKQFQSAGYDMRKLPLAIVETDAFRYRQVGGTQ